MLFGTKTCPNCEMAKRELDKAKISYKFVDAEEDVELTKSLGIKQAPTLVVVKKGTATLIPHVSNIKKYVEDNSK